MKRLTVVLAFGLLLVGCRENAVKAVENSTPEPTPAAVSSAPRTIEEIRQAQARTASQLESSQLDSTSVRYDCSGERSGTVTFYNDKGSVKLIRHRFAEYSHFEGTHDFYVYDGEPYFAFLQDLTWTFAGESETRDSVVQRRYYVLDGNPAECLEKKFAVLSSEKGSRAADAAPNTAIDCGSYQEVAAQFSQLYGMRERAGIVDCPVK